MKISYLFLLGLGVLFADLSQAQTKTDLESCQALIVASEKEYDASVYEMCGFADLNQSITYWAPLADKNNWRVALYEIYYYQNSYPATREYLYKSAQLGYAPALVLVGDELYDQKKISESMRYYNAALQSEDLSEEFQGHIVGRLAMLYADPSSPYYDIGKALPLLKKSALQRQALPNNLLGALTLFGQGGMNQNAEEAFKYTLKQVSQTLPLISKMP